MIIDTLEGAAQYTSLNPHFAKALDFLKRADLKDLEEGKYEIDGDKVYVMIVKQNGRNKSETQLEAHLNYIDIHYTIEGCEVFGWKSRSALEKAGLGYNEDGDCEMFDEAPATWLDIPKNNLVICLPDDPHIPMASEDYIHKAVVKIIAE